VKAGRKRESAASVSSTAAERPVGTVPSGPHRLSPAEWLEALKRSFKGFLADDAMGLSQQIAYSSLLAFFPALIFLIGLIGLIGIYDELKDFLGTVAPGAVIDAIEIAQENSRNRATASTAFVFGAFGAAWAASGAMNTIIKSVNKAYDRIETRPFWKTRLIALMLVVLTGLVTAFLFILIVFGGPVGEAIADKAGLGGAFDLVWGILRWPIAFAAILLFFALVYYLAPDDTQRNWKWISPGSLLGSLLWLALSGLFAVYTSFSDSYSETYGSLAGGIVLLLWLNYSAFALLFGAELNAELDRQADIHASGGPRAGLVEHARRTR
jgi:membrane protein